MRLPRTVYVYHIFLLYNLNVCSSICQFSSKVVGKEWRLPVMFSNLLSQKLWGQPHNLSFNRPFRRGKRNSNLRTTDLANSKL